MNKFILNFFFNSLRANLKDLVALKIFLLEIINILLLAEKLNFILVEFLFIIEMFKYSLHFQTLGCKFSSTISFENFSERMLSTLKLLPTVLKEMRARLKAILKCKCFVSSIRRSIKDLMKI